MFGITSDTLINLFAPAPVTPSALARAGQQPVNPLPAPLPAISAIILRQTIVDGRAAKAPAAARGRAAADWWLAEKAAERAAAADAKEQANQALDLAAFTPARLWPLILHQAGKDQRYVELSARSLQRDWLENLACQLTTALAAASVTVGVIAKSRSICQQRPIPEECKTPTRFEYVDVQLDETYLLRIDLPAEAFVCAG